MSWKVLFLVIALSIVLSQSYRLDDLIQRLNGYEKKWVSGTNTKFIDMTLKQTMSMMGTKLPIKP
jgi:hypothetical protein